MARTTRLIALTGLVGTLAITLGACSDDDPSTSDAEATATAPAGPVRIGFVAVGPEGAWRTANEQNIQDTFTPEAGFELTYAPAVDLDQQSQFDAFGKFVEDDVDVILLSATEATGWESVLGWAHTADIPVILLDRGIQPDNRDLYVTRISPDNGEVSRAVAEWAVGAFPGGANYVTLEGPEGVGVVDERNGGWDSVMTAHPEFVEVAAKTANWSLEEGKAVMTEMLAAHDNDIQLVFAQNDEMGLGAAQAVEAAGLTPGEDVKIATIDGTRAALEALAAGQLSFVHEYNPLFGETALEVVEAVLEDGIVGSYTQVPSQAFDSPKAAADALPNRLY